MDEHIVEQYHNLDIPKSTLDEIHSELKLPSGSLIKLARDKRIDALNEALNWEKGKNQENRKVTKLYSFENGFSVAVAKPGKEAAPDYRGCRYYAGEKKGEKTNNPNDMNPQILKDGEKFGKDLTFEDMFEKIEGLMHADLFGLELMGMLLFRASFMLDHEKDDNGNYRYYPPNEIVYRLENRIPQVDGIPTRVLLHFLVVLSLNEDVKVYTLGYKDLKKSYGRVNTLLTFSHLIAVFLERRSIARFAGSFARPPSGMAPLPRTKVDEYFPLLSNEWNQVKLNDL